MDPTGESEMAFFFFAILLKYGVGTKHSFLVVFYLYIHIYIYICVYMYIYIFDPL